MKKLMIFVVLVIAGYLVYNYFIKSKEAVHINASYTTSSETADPDEPSVSPKKYAQYKGSVENISGKGLRNVVIVYSIDGRDSKSRIGNLNPGEEVNFQSSPVLLFHTNASHYFKSVLYNNK